MPILIDGHNLIPKIGLRLDSFDDEMELVARLNEFCRLSRKTGLEVYFDGAPALQAGSRKIGLLKAHFVRAGLTADAAIARRLRALGKTAKNWSVVSSDRQIQAEARAARAEVIPSEQFAAQVISTLRAGPPSAEKNSSLTETELGEWLTLFGERNAKDQTKL
ncbi:MAG: NYN domain-containing protein [Anaerolineales bacterium]|jgi:predicted RNA-binding protein with PIN domain|nr:NYN domain-containing protein [Anaerolineales bacterium]